MNELLLTSKHTEAIEKLQHISAAQAQLRQGDKLKMAFLSIPQLKDLTIVK